jgi:hypothetical protein
VLRVSLDYWPDTQVKRVFSTVTNSLYFAAQGWLPGYRARAHIKILTESQPNFEPNF